jgi:putative hydrolases of HD superfamily
MDNAIPLPESVADHMYRMSMMSFMLADAAINKDYLMKICMVHDLAESRVGDITPHQGVSKEDKRKLEEDALRAIVAELDNQAIGAEILSLWLEYEEGTSYEADVARELDKYEMIVQANEYEIANPGKKLESFFSYTMDSFHHPEVLSWATLLRADRAARWSASEAK